MKFIGMLALLVLVVLAGKWIITPRPVPMTEARRQAIIQYLRQSDREKCATEHPDWEHHVSEQSLSASCYDGKVIDHQDLPNGGFSVKFRTDPAAINKISEMLRSRNEQ